MINAEEARQKTILGEAKRQKKLYINTVKKINRKIKEATKKGSYKVTYVCNYISDDVCNCISDDVCKLLITHYENLGYTIRTYKHNSWLYDDEIYVSWEEKA